MATTTNYSWETPDDADLVKDGAAAMRTLGNSIDTTLKALNPETTLGDIAYRSATSNTNTRLGIGTNGQVLAVSGGVPAWTTTADVTPLTTKGDLFTFDTADARLAVGTNGQTLVADSSTATGLKWATPSSGALVHIKTATFTSVADTSTTFDGVFTSTYNTYQIVFSAFGATPASAFQFQFRYAGPTTQAANYLWQNDIIEGAGPSSTLTRNASDTLVQIQKYMDNSGYGINGEINVYLDDVSGASRPSLTFNSFAEAYGAWVSGAAYVDAARTYTGFILKSASGNITGTVSVYGLVKA